MASRNVLCGPSGPNVWILNAGHLEHTVKVFVDHYNSRRLHRSVGLIPPNGSALSEDREE